jgi:ferredoxin-NADP reductase
MRWTGRSGPWPPPTAAPRRHLLQRAAAEDGLGETHDVEGFVSLDWLKANTPFALADFYLCGPKPFLRASSRD